MMNNETYFKGDRAVYTGKSDVIAGGRFYEIKIMEGRNAGKLKWTPKAPDGTSPSADIIKNEFQSQQGGFRRLRDQERRMDTSFRRSRRRL